MSRSAKKIKLELNTRSNGHRNEAKQSLHSGQFMTSRIDDNEVKQFIDFFHFYLLNISAY
jgi:hypothetical protein